MAIKITRSNFHTVGTVVSAPQGTEVDIAESRFVDCAKIVELRDPPSLLAFLGLSDETPLPLVREMLTFLAAGFVDGPSLKAKSEAIRILPWLNAGASVVTLVAALNAIYRSGALPELLKMLTA